MEFDQIDGIWLHWECKQGMEIAAEFGCYYGCADGPDDYINECDCEYTEQQKAEIIKAYEAL